MISLMLAPAGFLFPLYMSLVALSVSASSSTPIIIVVNYGYVPA